MTATAAPRSKCAVESARDFGNCLPPLASFLPVKQLMSARANALGMIAKYAKAHGSYIRYGYGPKCASQSEVQEWIQIVKSADFILDTGVDCNSEEMIEGVISLASRSCKGVDLGNSGIVIDRSGVDEFFEQKGYRSYEPWEAALYRPSPEISITVSAIECPVSSYVVDRYEEIITEDYRTSFEVVAKPYACALKALAVVSKEDEDTDYSIIGIDVSLDLEASCDVLLEANVTMTEVIDHCASIGLTIKEAETCAIAVATFSKINTGITACDMVSIAKVAEAVKCGIDEMSAAALWNVGVEVECSAAGVTLVAGTQCSTLENLKVAVSTAKDYLKDE